VFKPKTVLEKSDDFIDHHTKLEKIIQTIFNWQDPPCVDYGRDPYAGGSLYYHQWNILFRILQPKKILISGGYSNMDLFTACYGLNLNCEVKMYDPLAQTDRWAGNSLEWTRNQHEKLKEICEFTDSYEHIHDVIPQGGISGYTPDLIWLGWDIEEFLGTNYEAINMIALHSGKPREMFKSLYQIDKVCNMQVFTDRWSFHSNNEYDYSIMSTRTFRFRNYLIENAKEKDVIWARQDIYHSE